MAQFDLARFLPFRMARLAEALGREMAPIYRGALGLTRPEWRVLAHLGAGGAQSQRDLIALTAMDKVKVSRAVAGLEDRGWIARTPDPEDRRISRLTLTEAGQDTFAALAPRMLEGEARLLSRLPEETRSLLIWALDEAEKAYDLTPAPPED